MDTLKYIRRVDENNRLTLELPDSFRQQEVEVEVSIVKKTEDKPVSEMTKEEKLAILKKYEGSWPNWIPDVDLEDEWYRQ